MKRDKVKSCLAAEASSVSRNMKHVINCRFNRVKLNGVITSLFDALFEIWKICSVRFRYLFVVLTPRLLCGQALRLHLK